MIDAYKQIAAAFTVEHPGTKVVVDAYATHDEAMAAFREADGEG